MITTLDKFGRVLIPKKLREHLGLSLNSPVNIMDEGNRIIIETVKENEALINKDGILVFTGKVQKDLTDELKRSRSRRMDNILNPGKAS